MIKYLGRYILVIIALTFCLSGCISQIKKIPAPISEAQLRTDLSSRTEERRIQVEPLVPSVPSFSDSIKEKERIAGFETRLRSYDWNLTIQSMVSKMLEVQGVTARSLLLVDNISNRTNGLLNVEEATEILRQVLTNNDKFSLVSIQQLFLAKEKLGLSPQDSFSSRSKAIGIARNIGAQYVLYSNLTGNVNLPLLQMQLMLVKTGEILWSGNSPVMQL